MKNVNFKCDYEVFELISSVLNISVEEAVLKSFLYNEQAIKSLEKKLATKKSRGLAIPRSTSIKLSIMEGKSFKLKFKFYRQDGWNGCYSSCRVDKRIESMYLTPAVYSECLKEALSKEFEDVYLKEAK
jgi:hypothetical protein